MKSIQALLLAVAIPTLFSGAAIAQLQVYKWGTIAGVTGVKSEGVAVDTAGNLYVTTHTANSILKLTPEGTKWVTNTIAGSFMSGSADGTNSAARFYLPAGVAVDSAGNVYVGDAGNRTIRRITPVGTNWVTTTIAGLAGVTGRADGTNNAARFSNLWGVAVDSAGNLYVGDSDNHAIRKITPVGTNWVTTTIAGSPLAGSTDGTNSAARFSYPTGVAVDSAGNVFVADWNAHTIRKITPMGTNWVTTTVAGRAGFPGSANGTNGAARFDAPSGVAVDSAGNLYVSDEENGTVRKIRPMGTNWVTTSIGGLAGSLGSANGTNSAARFGLPNGLATDGRGNVYVVDYWNANIRKGVPLPVFQSVVQTNGLIAFTWSASAGQVFQVQCNSGGHPTNWQNLGTTITATNETMSASDALGADTHRIYRIELLP